MTPPQFLAAVAVSTLLDAAVALFALFLGREPLARESPPVIGAGRAAGAAAATTLVFLFKLPYLNATGVGLFGVVRLAYVDLTVLLPALGATLLLATLPASGRFRRRLTPPVRLAALAALAMAAVGVDATWVEPFRLQLETARVPLPDRREGRHPFRLGVLADLQIDRVTDYERGAVARLMAQKPDLILLPGDVFQGTPAEFEATRADLAALLARLDAPGGVYVVLGDTDGDGEHLRPLIGGTAVRLLVNESVRVAVGDRLVTVGGVELDYASPRARGLVARLEADGDERDVRILVAHRPDVALGLLPGSRVDLVVAGHTHGGQVVLPGFGPPVTLSNVPRAVAAGGLHRLGGNLLYVSRGVGCERLQAPRVRFFCPPEITLLEVGASGAGPEPGATASWPR